MKEQTLSEFLEAHGNCEGWTLETLATSSYHRAEVSNTVFVAGRWPGDADEAVVFHTRNHRYQSLGGKQDVWYHEINGDFKDPLRVTDLAKTYANPASQYEGGVWFSWCAGTSYTLIPPGKVSLKRV